MKSVRIVGEAGSARRRGGRHPRHPSRLGPAGPEPHRPHRHRRAARGAPAGSPRSSSSCSPTTLSRSTARFAWKPAPPSSSTSPVTSTACARSSRGSPPLATKENPIMPTVAAIAIPMRPTTTNRTSSDPSSRGLSTVGALPHALRRLQPARAVPAVRAAGQRAGRLDEVVYSPQRVEARRDALSLGRGVRVALRGAQRLLQDERRARGRPRPGHRLPHGRRDRRHGRHRHRASRLRRDRAGGQRGLRDPLRAARGVRGRPTCSASSTR